MEVQFWATTDPGRLREHNEDQFLVDEKLRLFVVCDGMGGHAAGEIASAISVRTIREVIYQHKHILENNDDANHDAIHKLLNKAVLAAGARVFELAQRDRARRGMGTTCIVLLFFGEKGFAAHVGDSRIYLIRNNEVHQLTEDHSVINEMIRQGKDSDEELALIPNKEALTRAVGVRKAIEVDTFEFPVQIGDRFLMCSDGLSGYFSHNDDILELLEGNDLQEISSRCIEFANGCGGRDNITVVLTEITEAQQSSWQQEVELRVEQLQNLPFFDGVSEPILWQIAQSSDSICADSGTDIVKEGVVHDTLYFVVEGTVAILRQEQPVLVLEKGQWFGEIGLFRDAHKGTYTASSLDDSQLIALRQSDFCELLERNAVLARKLLGVFLQKMTNSLAHIPYEFVVEPQRWKRVSFRENNIVEDDTTEQKLISDNVRHLAKKKPPEEPDSPILLLEDEVLDSMVEDNSSSKLSPVEGAKIEKDNASQPSSAADPVQAHQALQDALKRDRLAAKKAGRTTLSASTPPGFKRNAGAATMSNTESDASPPVVPEVTGSRNINTQTATQKKDVEDETRQILLSDIDLGDA